MQWLNYLWQGALAIMPLLFVAFKQSDAVNNRWGRVLLPLAETTWNAVEAWKKQQAVKPSPTASAQEFIRRMNAVKALSTSDKAALKEWASTRSLAAKKLAN
jgi:hypothetical protein